MFLFFFFKVSKGQLFPSGPIIIFLVSTVSRRASKKCYQDGSYTIVWELSLLSVRELENHERALTYCLKTSC